jgi:hypothetical protein
MTPLFQAALELQTELSRCGAKFCFIGGLAVLRWAEPRFTQDVDLTLFTAPGEEALVIDAMLGRFAARRAGAREFALRHRVLLLTASNGVPCDLALGALPFEQRMVGRASAFEFEPGCSLVTCSADDLIVLKAFADRPKDWLDVEAVLAGQGRGLDLNRIRSELRPLCELKDAPDILDRLADLVKGIGRRAGSGRRARRR